MNLSKLRNKNKLFFLKIFLGISLVLLLFNIYGLIALNKKDRKQDFGMVSQEKELRLGGGKCPKTPEGYQLINDSTKSEEYLKEGDLPWGGKYWDLFGHFEKGKIIPEIDIKKGEYAFFATTPSINQSGIERIFLGRTENIMEWLKCYNPYPEGSLLISVFEKEPDKRDLQNSFLEGQEGIRGLVQLKVKKIND